MKQGLYCFSEDLAMFSVYNNGRTTFGFINKAGNEVIKPIYSAATIFLNNISIVKMTNKDNKELFGIIDKNGRAITPTKYKKLFYSDCDTKVYGIPPHDNENKNSTCLNEIYLTYSSYDKATSTIIKTGLLLVELLGQRFYVDTKGFEYIE